jgi:hypothetical protein
MYVTWPPLICSHTKADRSSSSTPNHGRRHPAALRSCVGADALCSRTGRNWIKDYKNLPTFELADKFRVMLMKLFFRRRGIGEKLNEKIIPSVTSILNAKARGIGHFSLANNGYYCAEVQDNNNVLTMHIA